MTLLHETNPECTNCTFGGGNGSGSDNEDYPCINNDDDDDEFWAFNNYSRMGFYSVTTRTADLNRQLKDACRSGNYETVEWLTKEGAYDWDLGLEGACQGGQYKMMKLMIDRGATHFPYIISNCNICVIYYLLRSINQSARLQFIIALKFRGRPYMISYLINRHCFGQIATGCYDRNNANLHNITRQFTCDDIGKWMIKFCAFK